MEEGNLHEPFCLMNAQTRRQFLRESAALAAVAAVSANAFKTPVYGQNQAPSTGRVIGAGINGEVLV